MRHFADIRYNDLPRNIFSRRECTWRRLLLKCLRFDQVTEHHRNGLFIRHFNANRCLSRNRRFDTDVCGCQVKFDVIRQVDDLADLDAHFRLDLIAGYRRSAAYI